MNLLSEAAIFLAAAVVTVPLFRRFKLGAVLGYLAAGVIIGPCGFKFVTAVDNILHFAELGVVLLLFVIGLELQPSRLWVLRRSVFGLGSAQVLVTGARSAPSRWRSAWASTARWSSAWGWRCPRPPSCCRSSPRRASSPRVTAAPLSPSCCSRIWR